MGTQRLVASRRSSENLGKYTRQSAGEHFEDTMRCCLWVGDLNSRNIGMKCKPDGWDVPKHTLIREVCHF